MKDFFSALQFLTICPWPARAERAAEEIGRSASFFPIVGLLLGLCLGILDRALQASPSSTVTSVLLVAALAWLSRGLHLDGVADTFDGLGAGGDRERVLKIMDDSHTGAFGVIAVVLLLLLKVHALEAIESNRWRALIAAPLLGRWAMVLLAYRSQPAKTGLGAIFLENVQGKQLAIASFTSLLLVTVLFSGAGLVLAVSVALLAYGARYYLHHRLGGLTGDTCGAVCEISETSVWLLFAFGLG